jgi:hypothetical protein
MNKQFQTMVSPRLRRPLISLSIGSVLFVSTAQAQSAGQPAASTGPAAVAKPATTIQISLTDLDSRTAFYRMEKGAVLKLQIANKTAKLLPASTLEIDGAGLRKRRIALPVLAARQSTVVDVPLDTSLRPGSYATTVRLLDARQQPVGETLAFDVTIVARALPHKMPVVLWGDGNEDLVKEIGFTHQATYPVSYGAIWDKGAAATALPQESAATLRKRYDRMFAKGLGGIGFITPGRYVGTDKQEYNRVDLKGKRLDNANGLHPRVQQFAYDTGAAVARTFGDLPGLQASLIHTEIRDHTKPSFSDIDKAAYKKDTGQDIPLVAENRRGVPYQTIKDFPKDRIVADDNPILRYYSWFWKRGDGWYGLNSAVDKGLKSTGRKDIWTFFDPAVRTPSITGATGDVDYLSQWTYTYPEPEKIGLAADELSAMAAGAENPQGIMKMTQIIWYRSQTAPIPANGQAPVANPAAWEKEIPDAKFITIAPDILSEALWLKLSRPVKGIMYHGWGSLTGASHSSYRLTNKDTQPRLQKLIKDVVEPLGPTLLQVPDASTDVAFLESFASQMFANRGTWGWGNGWGADAYLVARYAGLQPQIVYDETIKGNGLDQYKVLFLTDCDVLTEGVADAVSRFQQRGGIVVGDERLAPRIQPDILLSSFRRTNKADQDQASLMERATALRTELDPFYLRAVESSNPKVLVRQRRFGSSDYVFVANDNRTFGDYVGQYKRVMEKGLPATTTITLNRPSGTVYDLTRRQMVPTRVVGKTVRFDVALGAGDGNAFVVLDAPVGPLQITGPARAQRGQSISYNLRLGAAGRRAINAVVPVTVRIRDAQGREAERSGHYGAVNGQLSLNLDIAPNDDAGRWSIEATEGLGGQKVMHPLIVS